MTADHKPSTNVIHMPKARPASHRHQYKKHEIIITFNPITSQWSYVVEHTHTVEFKSEAKTKERALKAAKTFIDKIEMQ